MKLLLMLVLMFNSFAFANEMVKGMNLTELGSFKYAANDLGMEKTPAQIAVDQIYDLGARHIVLNPTGIMTDPNGNTIIPKTSVSERSQERSRYKKLIKYIHSKGMSVGLRPIFFVVHPDGRFPYVERGPNGNEVVRWHGNIRPSDPERWFESFKAYLDPYILIAKLNKVEEFTIGAELYSMTVGIEDQWKEHPFGFPKRWLDLLKYVRGKLGAKTRIMYDINFTDDKVTHNGDLSVLGGELERWRYRLVDLANPSDPEEYETWQDLVAFWNGLDAIGIDMYRSLASKSDVMPESYEGVVGVLSIRANEYASQLDTTMVEIESVTEKAQKLIFKEVGYRSITKGFINPYEYEDGTGEYNEEHQAAAYEALRRAFWLPGFDWFQGASFWDVSVDPKRNTGYGDRGFSPIGKEATKRVIADMFEN